MTEGKDFKTKLLFGVCLILLTQSARFYSQMTEIKVENGHCVKAKCISKTGRCIKNLAFKSGHASIR